MNMGFKNRVLLSSVSYGIKLIKKVSNIIKDRKLQRALLLGSLLAYVLVALVATKYFWSVHGLKLNPMYGRFNLYIEVILYFTICISLVQGIAHVVKGGPLLPDSLRNRVILALLHMALSLVVNGGSGATNGYQEFLTDLAPNFKSDDQLQVLLYSRWTSAASTIYGAVVYLTTNLAEPEPTQDLENADDDDSSPSKMIYAWTLVPRLFQCAFAIAGSMTMRSAPDYDFYAFKFMVLVNFCSATWNCLVCIPTIYSAWRSFSFPSWVHTSIWFLDMVMLSVVFRGLVGAAIVVYVISIEMEDCDQTTCGIFAKAIGLTLISYICILLPGVLSTVKRIYGT